VTQVQNALSPQRRPGEYVFATIDAKDRSKAAMALASVVEPEGLSIVLSRKDADETRIVYDSVFGWITLMVESALDSVGLTAAVSGVLAQSGISCNVIAGYHHDHLLVAIDRVDDALDAISDLTWRQS
jgi:uncharacterized protein